MDLEKLVPASVFDEDKIKEVGCSVAPRPRRRAHRATSEERDPSYLPFTISKRWEPTPSSEEAESNRRYTQKWTPEQVHALEDGVEM